MGCVLLSNTYVNNIDSELKQVIIGEDIIKFDKLILTTPNIKIENTNFTLPAIKYTSFHSVCVEYEKIKISVN